MRKIILSIFILIALCLPVMAADVGTCTETLEDSPGSLIKVVKLDCVAATGDIVRTLTKSDAIKGHMLMQINVTPIIAPTASSDLYIYAGSGVRVSGTDFENIVTTSGTITYPQTGRPICWSSWTIDIDNNVVAAARVIIEMFFYKL